ncbi:MAG: CoA-binding protein [Candidatus Pacebacteria bacterium]|nr:CoA-binding protein [Candidatus Paceibacterota bacterium]
MAAIFWWQMQKLFNPKSIVLIGATGRQGSVGLGIAKNLLAGAGKRRKIFFVNPNSAKVLNRKTFVSIGDIKEKIDLAIIAVPSRFVEGVGQECCLAGVGAAVIISSGFAETGVEGEKAQQAISEMFARNNIPLVGPNCLGVINPSKGLNASFAPETPQKGNIAFLSQSGALVDSIIDKSLSENFGFSLMVSYGNEAGLSLNDFLKIADEDKNTEVIVVYLEEIKNGREFMKIASGITGRKPIVILKGGKTREGKKAVQSHTASLAGDEKIYSAAFAQAGIVEAETIEDLFLIARTLSVYPKAAGPWAVLTNGGAVGVLTADWCSKLGVGLAEIPQAVFDEIAKSEKVNAAFSRNNPLDIIGDASSQGYEAALWSLLGQKEISGVIFCQTLQAMTDPFQNAEIIIEARKRFPEKPVLPLFLGGKTTKKGSDALVKKGLFCFNEPRDAALAARSLQGADIPVNY